MGTRPRARPRARSSAPMYRGDVLSLRDVRTHFSQLADEVARTHERITVTPNGKPAAVLVSPDDLASMQETLDVLANTDLMRQLIASRAELESGTPGIPLEKIQAKVDRRKKARTRRRA